MYSYMAINFEAQENLRIYFYLIHCRKQVIFMKIRRLVDVSKTE